MIAVTQHDTQAAGDYARLGEFGIRTARDAVRWHLIERAGQFDFASLAPMAAAAREAGVQIIWDLCHYGWPDDLDLFAPAFVDRFARFAAAVARFLAQETDATPFYAPINEISFFSWAAGEVGWFYPHGYHRGWEMKEQLVRATIAATEAVRAVDRRARFVQVDPVIHVIPPRDRPDLAPAAASQHNSQWEAWDMLAGLAHPELGGRPEYLDIVGVNYYHSNEWEYPDQRLRWEDTPRDDRWVPFHRLLANVYERYGRPLFVGETSHFGVGRGPWIQEMAAEVRQALALGVPVEGICIYPILDRPDWEDFNHWHNSGLWDLIPNAEGRLERVLNEPYAADLRRSLSLPD
jgi:beta-glucosidase/6-phospho-beta-glucosidase/beta-galactosidase